MLACIGTRAAETRPACIRWAVETPPNCWERRCRFVNSKDVQLHVRLTHSRYDFYCKLYYQITAQYCQIQRAGPTTVQQSHSERNAWHSSRGIFVISLIGANATGIWSHTYHWLYTNRQILIARKDGGDGEVDTKRCSNTLVTKTHHTHIRLHPTHRNSLNTVMRYYFTLDRTLKRANMSIIFQ